MIGTFYNEYLYQKEHFLLRPSGQKSSRQVRIRCIRCIRCILPLSCVIPQAKKAPARYVSGVSGVSGVSCPFPASSLKPKKLPPATYQAYQAYPVYQVYPSSFPASKKQLPTKGGIHGIHGIRLIRLILDHFRLVGRNQGRDTRDTPDTCQLGAFFGREIKRSNDSL